MQAYVTRTLPHTVPYLTTQTPALRLELLCGSKLSLCLCRLSALRPSLSDPAVVRCFSHRAWTTLWPSAPAATLPSLSEHLAGGPFSNCGPTKPRIARQQQALGLCPVYAFRTVSGAVLSKPAVSASASTPQQAASGSSASR